MDNASERKFIWYVLLQQHTNTSPNVYDASTCASYVSILQRTRIKLFSWTKQPTIRTYTLAQPSFDGKTLLHEAHRSRPCCNTILAAAAMVMAAVLLAAHWIFSKRCFSFTIPILCVLAAKRHKLYVSQYIQPSHQYTEKWIRWIHSKPSRV